MHQVYSPQKARLNNRPTKTMKPACPLCTEGKVTFVNSQLVIHEDGVCPKVDQSTQEES
jgi:hypothetical protein